MLSRISKASISQLARRAHQSAAVSSMTRQGAAAARHLVKQPPRGQSAAVPKRFFSEVTTKATANPAVSVPKEGGRFGELAKDAARKGESLPKEGGGFGELAKDAARKGESVLKEGGGLGEIPKDAAGKGESPWKNHRHHMRCGGRRGFGFGRFLALGFFGFLGYRALVGPPVLMQSSDDEGKDRRQRKEKQATNEEESSANATTGSE